MKSSRTVIIGISSGIAAYKILDLVKLLRVKKFEVHVIMTKHASRMFSPKEFEKASKHKVVTVLFPEGFDYKKVLGKREVEHIELASKADLVVIAPATGNIIGKIAAGIADDFVTTVVLATKAPILVCPSMNSSMWENPAVSENIKTLKKRKFYILSPEIGSLACGLSGAGRLPKVELIVSEIIRILKNKEKLKSKKIMVTAGAALEEIDAVRVISNRASGKMGKAIAEEAFLEGAEVLLLRARSAVSSCYKIKEEIFETGDDLYYLTKKYIQNYDFIFHTAAVSDYIPKKKFAEKLDSRKSLTVDLEPAEKIINKIKIWNPKIKLVGFKAVYKEKDKDLIKIGLEKLKNSGSDYVIVNDVGREGIGFAACDNEVYIISPKGLVIKIDKAPKAQVAKKILEYVF